MSPINSRLRNVRPWGALAVWAGVLDQVHFQMATALDRVRAPLTEAVWSWRWPR